MVESARDENAVSWFVALPDCAAAMPAADKVRPRAKHEVAHPSGRPWLLGSWADGAMVVGDVGLTKLAVIGQHAVTPGQLDAAAATIRSIADLDRLAHSLVGSTHLIASVGGRVRAQGTVTGLRRLFHARVGGATVVADATHVLSGLLNSEVDEERLALHLLGTSALYPLAGQPVWRGVSALATDEYLVLDEDGRHRSIKWWTVPEPVVPLADGAPKLRDALTAAVRARVAHRDLVSCDLGGLDSTSLCCLAAGSGVNVLAYTADGSDPMADDVAWARRTLAAFPHVEHEVMADGRLPMVYDGVLRMDARLEEPSAAAVCLDRYLALPRAAASRGSSLHLCGFGGDELLAGSPAHLHALLRTHPRLALRNARGFATQRPWHYREVVRQLASTRPYRAWLAQAGDELTAPVPPPRTPTLDWGSPPRMPPWATPAAVQAARGLIRDAARTVEPLAPGRGQHVELEAMRATSRMVRQLGQLTAQAGIELAAPYYDDRVLEAGLAVRPQDRVTPWRYKPLIVEAMRGIVPDESLTRQTKDEGSYEVEAGLSEHRNDLMSLWDDSYLARMGLIDAAALREVCSRPLPPSLPYDVLFQTVACEVWLRTARPAPVS